MMKTQINAGLSGDGFKPPSRLLSARRRGSERSTVRFLRLLPVLLFVFAGSCSRDAEQEDTAVAPDPGEGRLAVRAWFTPEGPQAEDVRIAIETIGGEQVARPTSRTEFELEAGRYLVKASLDRVETTAEAEVRSGELEEVDIILDAGVIDLTAVLAADGDPAADARYTVLSGETDIHGERETIARPTSRSMFTLPAGNYRVRVSLGEAAVEEDVTVLAGEREAVTLALDAGVLDLTAVLAADGDPAAGARYTVLSGETDIRGERETIARPTSRSMFTLPAGNYRVRASLGEAAVEEDVTVRAGEREAVKLDLNAGVLHLTARSAAEDQTVEGVSWEILAADEDLHGRHRPASGRKRGEEVQVIVAAGNYIVQARSDDQTVRETVAVEAGERRDVTVEF